MEGYILLPKSLVEYQFFLILVHCVVLVLFFVLQLHQVMVLMLHEQKLLLVGLLPLSSVLMPLKMEVIQYLLQFHHILQLENQVFHLQLFS